MESKKEPTSEQTKEGMFIILFLVISAVATYFFYKWFVVDLLVPLFNLGTGWKIGITIIFFFMAFGSMYEGYNRLTFFDTHKYGFKSSEDATSKIAKLKELKDKGAISKQEFEKKKKELLEKV